MPELPRRYPGHALAELQKSTSPPEGGWFGPDVEWPDKDPDEAIAVGYLKEPAEHAHSSLLPDSPAANELLRNVLDGLRRLDGSA